MKTNRREFMRRWGSAVGSATVLGPWHGLLARYARGEETGVAPGFGPLRSCVDETTGLPLIKLPEGFRCISFGWNGDAMVDGIPTPPLHDGMGVVASNQNEVILCRNHEINVGPSPFGADEITYDTNAGGGCTQLRFDTKSGSWIESRSCLSGTVKNCAGGATPWNTWLSCEETVLGPGDLVNGQPAPLQQAHGWIFDVPIDNQSTPVPLTEMGRFVHEAVAVDPESGIVYETEDRETSGFYRFLPNVVGNLARGGRLQMLKLPRCEDLRQGIQGDATYDVQWVDIEDPTLAHSPGTEDSLGVFNQGKIQQAATFARLEGCWFDGQTAYFVSTSGGDAKCGQVWAYLPAEHQLRLVFESPDKHLLKMPDNMTVSPRGGILLCEDSGEVGQRLQGLTTCGRVFPLAANDMVLQGEKNGIIGDFREQEFAGVTFSPDGEWLFVNIQTPGITFAITGPWQEGLV
jgi:secreted PhoX family phosphatase